MRQTTLFQDLGAVVHASWWNLEFHKILKIVSKKAGKDNAFKNFKQLIYGTTNIDFAQNASHNDALILLHLSCFSKKSIIEIPSPLKVSLENNCYCMHITPLARNHQITFVNFIVNCLQWCYQLPLTNEQYNMLLLNLRIVNCIKWTKNVIAQEFVMFSAQFSQFFGQYLHEN